jgi:glycosyltransferase involved in cell wall biosynthesis
MKEKKRYHLVQIGSLGFPVGMASVEKIRLISIGLIENGFDVTTISRYGILNKDSGFNFSPKGTLEGINYVFTSGSIYRPGNFFGRNSRKLLGVINEFRLLWKFRREDNLDFAILNEMDFWDLIYYKMLSLIFRFKLFYLLVEYSAAMTSRQNFAHRLSDYLFEKIGYKLIDGVLPISKLLTDYLIKIVPGKPFFKIPVLVDFSKFENIDSDHTEIRFLYCGAVEYSEVIYFILESFESLKTRQDAYLYLIIGGSEIIKEEIRNHVRKMVKKDFVKILSNLPYSELVQMYKSATALLIPLRPTLQDEARFPHKIGEYLASGNPIITTNIGEVKYYFKDSVNAFVAEEYTTEAFIEKMECVLKDPQKAKQIGLNGKEFGKENFDCMAYGKLLSSFLISLK